MYMQITDNLEMLLAVLPTYVRNCVEFSNKDSDLIEIVMDYGRRLVLRYYERTVTFDNVVSKDDIDEVVQNIFPFGDDNRSGISGTLHRISCIRNRRREIIGLTCRVGRVIKGVADPIKDLIASGESVLLVGRPGGGKTSRLREAARLLADEYGKRVVVVDTSNEIAGEGDIPHEAIGSARRMQVEQVALQYRCMIESVENHMPQVIIVDEIGNEEETHAARTIAERGVQLIATAHGSTLEDILHNESLNDLLGGVCTVTISDTSARQRGTNKTIPERKLTPTFSILIEIVDRDTMVVYRNVAEAVDALLCNKSPKKEIRKFKAGVLETTEVEGDAEPSSRNEEEFRLFFHGIDIDLATQAISRFGTNFHIVRRVSEATHVIIRKKLMGRLNFEIPERVTVVTIANENYNSIISVVKKIAGG
jgi:stage III sporulation protein AA